ncbi:MAG: alpha/beta hydrolase [Glaciihabitans sp.]
MSTSPAPSLADADVTFYPTPSRAGAGTDTPAGAPLILVFPGGGYQHHASHEGGPVAEWLASIGINALVVRYPVEPHRYPAALRRVQDILVAARTGALDFGDASVDRTRIGVLGFSAGGHLAALASTGVASTPIGPEGRVDLSVLCYPVISMTHEPHSGSLDSLLGDADTLDARRALSAENLVDAATPHTFLWHTADDGAVPVSHALRYASALAAHNVPFDLHVFERGDHGKGLALGLGPLEEWSRLCALWLAGYGWTDGA